MYASLSRSCDKDTQLGRFIKYNKDDDQFVFEKFIINVELNTTCCDYWDIEGDEMLEDYIGEICNDYDIYDNGSSASIFLYFDSTTFKIEYTHHHNGYYPNSFCYFIDDYRDFNNDSITYEDIGELHSFDLNSMYVKNNVIDFYFENQTISLMIKTDNEIYSIDDFCEEFSKLVGQKIDQMEIDNMDKTYRFYQEGNIIFEYQTNDIILHK